MAVLNCAFINNENYSGSGDSAVNAFAGVPSIIVNNIYDCYGCRLGVGLLRLGRLAIASKSLRLTNLVV
jgi:hypothetical protein